MPRFLQSALSALVAIGLVVAWTSVPPTSYTFDSTPNEMRVEGGSTIHDWSCPIKTLDGTLQVDTAGAAKTPIAPPSKVQVSIPVDAITCDNGTMNEKLREALKMESHPQVQFSLQEAQVSPLPDSGSGWFQVDATGTLTLAGNQRQIDLPVSGQRLENGDLRFVGRHTIRLSDYGIERPSAMFGAIKVSKKVTVHFDVTATPNANERD
ncbi:MAG: YceI family protein [Salinibacter sp.]